MWKCKSCGSDEINAVYSGEWIAYKKVKDKYGQTDKLNKEDKSDIGGYIYEYECESSGNRSEKLNDMANWEE